MPESCIFCRIADQQIPVELLYNDDLFVAIRDANPVAPVHLLIIPKKHTPSILELTSVDADTMGRVFEIAAELARKEHVDGSGFRLVVNTGQAAGQTVPHIHFHLLGGRDMGWPPG